MTANVGPIGGAVGEEARLQALSAELARVSADQSSFLSLIVGFISSALLAAGGLVALQSRGGPEPSPDWQWGVVILVPLMLAAYAITQTGKTVIRQYYARELERQILDLTDPNWRISTGLPVGAVYESLSASFEGNKRGEPSVRLTLAVLYYLVSALVAWASIYVLINMRSWGYRVIFGAAFVLVIVPAGVSARHAFLRGRAMWARVSGRASIELRRPLVEVPPPSRRRSLGSYLLLPRPNDFIVKAVLLHLMATVFGGLLLFVRERSDFSLRDTVLSGIALIVGFEYLVYQSRYMLNDWRGRDSDTLHQYSDLRGRAPDLSTGRRKTLFVVGGTLRALLGLALPFLILSWRRATIVVMMSAVAYALAAFYEWLRKRTTVSKNSRPTVRSSVPVYLAVGTSYGLRAGAGVWFGTDGRLPARIAVAIGCAFYFVGLMSVLMVWVLEGASGLVWSKSPHGGVLQVHESLMDKSHVVALGLVVKPPRQPDWTLKAVKALGDADGKHLAAPRPLSAPYNLAAVAAMSMAAGAGATLFSWPASFRWPALLAMAVGALVGLGVVRGGSYLAISIALTALSVVVVLEAYDAAALLALVPAVLAAVTYLQIRPLTYQQAINFMAKVRSDLKGAWMKLGALVAELRT